MTTEQEVKLLSREQIEGWRSLFLHAWLNGDPIAPREINAICDAALDSLTDKGTQPLEQIAQKLVHSQRDLSPEEQGAIQRFVDSEQFGERVQEASDERDSVDAARYRFLRECAVGSQDGAIGPIVWRIEIDDSTEWDFDAAIDAAMGAAPITREDKPFVHAFSIKRGKKDGYWFLHGEELVPGLNLCGPDLSTVLADLIPAWQQLHRIAPEQVPAAPESALNEAQWVSVPLEPTEEMLRKGAAARPFMGSDWTPGQITAATVYRAMLAALHRDKPQPHEEG